MEDQRSSTNPSGGSQRGSPAGYSDNRHDGNLYNFHGTSSPRKIRSDDVGKFGLVFEDGTGAGAGEQQQAGGVPEVERLREELRRKAEEALVKDAKLAEQGEELKAYVRQLKLLQDEVQVLRNKLLLMLSKSFGKHIKDIVAYNDAQKKLLKFIGCGTKPARRREKSVLLAAFDSPPRFSGCGVALRCARLCEANIQRRIHRLVQVRQHARTRNTSLRCYC